MTINPPGRLVWTSAVPGLVRYINLHKLWLGLWHDQWTFCSCGGQLPNLDGSITSTLGVGWTDFLEIGGYVSVSPKDSLAGQNSLNVGTVGIGAMELDPPTTSFDVTFSYTANPAWGLDAPSEHIPPEMRPTLPSAEPSAPTPAPSSAPGRR